MIVKKFYASNSREALRQVRELLGDDALILSNRQLADGAVEIMAVADAELETANLPPLPEVSPTPPPSAPAPAGAPEAASIPAAPAPKTKTVRKKVVRQVTPARQPIMLPDELKAALLAEVDLLRGMVRGQLAGFAWHNLQQHDPNRLELFRRLLAAGFSPALARQLFRNMPQACTLEAGMKWVRAAMLHNFNLIAAPEDLVRDGGVYAVVGPTGVGKTTTVAKLAARCVMRQPAGGIALITTDSYRIGAHDQLRIYGRILGVQVFAVKDAHDLQRTLDELSNYFLILIDTVGMSQRDKRIAEQAQVLNGDVPIRRLLAFSAACQGNTLQDIIDAYRPYGLDGCIMTKLDETIGLGAGLDVVIRNRLPLVYIATGQRVPEDLHPANPDYLIDRALRHQEQKPAFVLHEDEYPLVAAAMAEHDRDLTHDRLSLGMAREPDTYQWLK